MSSTSIDLYNFLGPSNSSSPPIVGPSPAPLSSSSISSPSSAPLSLPAGPSISPIFPHQSSFVSNLPSPAIALISTSPCQSSPSFPSFPQFVSTSPTAHPTAAIPTAVIPPLASPLAPTTLVPTTAIPIQGIA
ncbi:hypothetical protein U1Q18_043951, partial [Sarracenia purpurea var. burkii]